MVLGVATTEKIDASGAPELNMIAPIFLNGGATVLGGASANTLQGSLGDVSTVTFSNGTTGLVADSVGADHITGGSGGGDLIFGDGGPDTITLPNHRFSDTVLFGEDLIGGRNDVLAITDGLDKAYLGSWGVTGQATAIYSLFPGVTGGTSADMTVITGFNAGPGGDVLAFRVAAWNGASVDVAGPVAAQGDLVHLVGAAAPTTLPVAAGAAQLSQVWVDSSSNSSLNASDDVLRYAPSDVSLHSAQQLAEQLHTSSDAIVLPGAQPHTSGIFPLDVHILVAYAAANNVVNIADVDLVDRSLNTEMSTADSYVQVYASDMVSLVGVSLASLTPDNIHFV
jgi:hypothetical protein